MTSHETTAVLLCTFNGVVHLEEQLASLLAQQSQGLSIVASDDGSRDGTVELLGRLAETASVPIQLRSGPGRGHAANFLSLVCDTDIQADYFAFSDQDDLWDSGKLNRAISRLAAVTPSTPALYCGRTRSISESGAPLGLSPLFCKPPGFRNALVQNIAGGNTMVFNAAARELLVRAGMVDVPTHDWWVYLLISAAGGQVVYDPEPTLSYRQHGGNEIGANLGWSDRLRRYAGALKGRNRAWGNRNIQALNQCRHLLKAENRALLDVYQNAREQGLIGRLAGVRSAGLYAQTFSGNLGLFAATLLKKI